MNGSKIETGIWGHGTLGESPFEDLCFYLFGVSILRNGGPEIPTFDFKSQCMLSCPL